MFDDVSQTNKKLSDIENDFVDQQITKPVEKREKSLSICKDNKGIR